MLNAPLMLNFLAACKYMHVWRKTIVKKKTKKECKFCSTLLELNNIIPFYTLKINCFSKLLQERYITNRTLFIHAKNWKIAKCVNSLNYSIAIFYLISQV